MNMSKQGKKHVQKEGRKSLKFGSSDMIDSSTLLLGIGVHSFFELGHSYMLRVLIRGNVTIRVANTTRQLVTPITPTNREFNRRGDIVSGIPNLIPLIKVSLVRRWTWVHMFVNLSQVMQLTRICAIYARKPVSE